tara:strand:+ start:267 stop:521 length:255 start_codon:yes stop_codon:yes gene_type:complete
MMNMKARDKSPALDAFFLQVTGKSRPDTVRDGLCMTCDGEYVTMDLKDQLSRDEYLISGMCQDCQDSVFTDEDEHPEGDTKGKA